MVELLFFMRLLLRISSLLLVSSVVCFGQAINKGGGGGSGVVVTNASNSIENSGGKGTNTDFFGTFSYQGTPVTTLISNISGNIYREKENQGPTWNIWKSNTTYYARYSISNTVYSSNNFSGLFQTVHDNTSEPILNVNIGPISSAGTSLQYYWASNTILITKGANISGFGNPISVITTTNLNKPVFRFGTNGSTISGIAEIRNLRFQALSTNLLGVALEFNSCSEPVMRFCEFNNFGRAGVEIDNVGLGVNFWSLIHDCWFVVPTNKSPSAGILLDNVLTTSELHVWNCMFSTDGGDCINAETFGFNGLNVKGNRFFQNSGETNVAIRMVYSADTVIEDNYFYNWHLTNSPIYFMDSAVGPWDSDALVMGNYSTGANTNLTYVGVDNNNIQKFGNYVNHSLIDTMSLVDSASVSNYSLLVTSNSLIPFYRENDWRVWKVDNANYYAIGQGGKTNLATNNLAGMLQHIDDLMSADYTIKFDTGPHDSGALTLYWISNTVYFRKGVKLIGQGWSSTSMASTNINVPLFNFGSNTTSAGSLTECRDLAFYDLSAAPRTGAVGCFFENAPEPVLRNCLFSHFGDAGVKIENVNGNFYSFMQNCWLLTPTNRESACIKFTSPIANPSEFWVWNSLFNTDGGNCIDNRGSFYGLNIRDCRFHYALGATNVALLSYYASQTTVEGCTFMGWPEDRRPLYFMDADLGSIGSLETFISGNTSTASDGACTTNLVHIGVDNEGIIVVNNVECGILDLQPQPASANLTNFANLGITNANTLWVRRDGSDATALRGRYDKPWLSLSNALQNALAGDTVRVGPGFFTNANNQTDCNVIGSGREATYIYSVGNWLTLGTKTSIEDLTYEGKLDVRSTNTYLNNCLFTNSGAIATIDNGIDSSGILEINSCYIKNTGNSSSAANPPSTFALQSSASCSVRARNCIFSTAGRNNPCLQEREAAGTAKRTNEFFGCQFINETNVTAGFLVNFNAMTNHVVRFKQCDFLSGITNFHQGTSGQTTRVEIAYTRWATSMVNSVTIPWITTIDTDAIKWSNR